MYGDTATITRVVGARGGGAEVSQNEVPDSAVERRPGGVGGSFLAVSLVRVWGHPEVGLVAGSALVFGERVLLAGGLARDPQGGADQVPRATCLPQLSNSLRDVL